MDKLLAKFLEFIKGQIRDMTPPRVDGQLTGTGWGISVIEGGEIQKSRAVVRAHQRLAIDLHPDIVDKVRPQFLMGEYELAAFAALWAVEVRVRRAIGASDSDIGVGLIQQALGEDGPFWDSSLDRGEQIARMNLFAGALGYFKNPTSHREVTYDNPAEASEVIMLADLLLRILDRLQADCD
jgi:uncharacterized protein (TIGR02391 family)